MPNNGPQPKTMLKYLFFIFAYLKKYNKKSLREIQLTSDKELFNDFHIDYHSSTEFINRLTELRIIKCVDNAYLEGVSCCKYNISKYYYRENLIKYLPQFDRLFENKKDEDIQNIEYVKQLISNIYVLKNSNLFYLNIDEEIADFIISSLVEDTRKNDLLSIIQNKDYYDKMLNYDTYNISEEDRNIRKMLHLLRRKKSSDLLGKITITKYTNKLTDREKSILSDAYISLLLYNPIIQMLATELSELNSRGYHITCPINVKIKDNKRVKISNSGRQNNYLCFLSKDSRKVENGKDGFDLNFDLHSAIYAVARLLNQNEWDCDWDIKEEILSRQNNHQKISDMIIKTDGSLIEKADLKKLMFRNFFATSLSQSWAQYNGALRGFGKNTGKQHVDFDGNKKKYYNLKHSKQYVEKKQIVHEEDDELPLLDKENYEKIYSMCTEKCGDINKYQYVIFYWESLLECRVIKEMLNRGYAVRNVYDCFYFKSSETTVEEVKKIITDVAHTVYNDSCINSNDLWAKEKKK